MKFGEVCEVSGVLKVFLAFSTLRMSLGAFEAYVVTFHLVGVGDIHAL